MNTQYRLLTVALVLIFSTAALAEEPETTDRPERRGGAGRVASDRGPGRPGRPNAAAQGETRPGQGGGFRQGDGPGRASVGRGEGGPRGRGKDRGPAQAEYVRKAMSWLKENNPEEFKRLTRLREENPRALRQELGPMLQAYAKEKNPAQYKRLTEGRKHAQQMRAYAQEYRKETDPEKRTAIKQKMRTTLTDSFDKKQESREKELKMLEERIVKFRETLKQSNDNRQSIIDSQMKQWTRETDTEE
jgi:hypothetical protein